MARYSHSSLSTFKNCPLQFKFKYIDRIKVPETDSVEAFLGSRVHETFEKLYKGVILSRVMDLDEMLRHYEELWKKNWHTDVCIRKAEMREEDYFNTGIRAISDYYRRYHPFDSTRPLAVEKRLTFSIAGRYSFIGFIDRLDSAGDGIYEIHDYKTSATLPDEGRFEYDTQLALYHIGLKQHYSDADRVRLIWHYLVFDKEFSIEKSGDELNRIEKETASLIEEIESTTEFPPCESALCDWCDYPACCPAKKHIVLTDEMAPGEFLEEDGVRLVNRYAEVRSELSRLDLESGELRNKLIAYADRHGCANIRGSDNILKISKRNVFRYSALDEAGRKALEEALKSAGLWDEVAGINHSRLNKVISSLKPDDENGMKIRDMLDEETETRLTLKSIRKEG